MKRVEIAGGGLAGLSLGIALRHQDVPVTIYEAGRYPRHRVCGEFINGVTQETLARLGVDVLFKNALRHEKTRWWIGDERVLEAELDRPALGMSRWEMDEILQKEFIRLEGDLQVKTRALREAREGFVWAAGRVLQKGSEWLGLKAHFTGIELEDYLEMHLGKGGYVGLTPVREGINVCGLFKKRSLKGEDLMMSYLEHCRLKDLAERLRAGEMNQESFTGVSGLQLGNQSQLDVLCSLGDAERMIPPFTGNGMSMAFESADCAIQPLTAWAKGEITWELSRFDISAALEKRFSRRVRLAMALHHALTTSAGRRGLISAARAGVLPFGWLHRNLS